MLNVLSLVPYKFLPARTGGQKAIAHFYKYFSRQVTLSCAGVQDNHASNADGYPLIPLLSPGPLRYLNPALFFRMRRLIREKRADYLLIEHPYFGWLGYALKKSTHVKLVIRSHNIEGLRWKSLGKWWWRILWAYERFTHRQADYNIFILEAEKQYAIDRFGLDAARCLTMTFGVERHASPTSEEKSAAREKINLLYGLEKDIPVLLINGAFQYGPNRQALEDLLHRVNPLLQASGLRYQILVCGMDIPADLLAGEFPGVKMLGFVGDLDQLLTGADMLLNPVLAGGGIKTKLVEALAYGLNAVSTSSGAAGIDPAICNGKLSVSADNDWPAFAGAIRVLIPLQAVTPAVFFEHFSWELLARKAALFLAGDNRSQ